MWHHLERYYHILLHKSTVLHNLTHYQTDLDSRKSESSQYPLGVCYVAAVDEEKGIKLHGYDTKLNIIKLFNHKPGNLGLAMAGAL